jgi:hypothetical protein
VLRVEEKRKNFSSEVILSFQCSEWLVSTMVGLLGSPVEQDFVKSFREGPKVLIARIGGNKAGRFLEATVFRMGGRKGFILIPEGSGGWGWHKFSGELRKAADYLSAMVGCGLGSSSALEQKDGKVEGTSLGLATKWTGLSFAEVLRSNLITAMKKVSSMGVLPSRLRDSPVESRDFLPVMRFAEEDQRTAVDCYSLESPPLDPLDKVQNHRPLGKKSLPSLNLNFKYSNLCTWKQLVISFKLAMGQATGKFMGRFFGSGLGWKHTGIGLGRFMPRPRASRSESASGKMLGLHFIGGGSTRRLRTGPGLDRKHSGCRLGRFLPNPKTNRPASTTLEMSPESAFGELLGLHFTGDGLSRHSRTDPVGVDPVSPVPLGCSLRQIPSSSTSGMAPFLSSSWGDSGSFKSSLYSLRVSSIAGAGF